MGYSEGAMLYGTDHDKWQHYHERFTNGKWKLVCYTTYNKELPQGEREKWYIVKSLDSNEFVLETELDREYLKELKKKIYG